MVEIRRLLGYTPVPYVTSNTNTGVPYVSELAPAYSRTGRYIVNSGQGTVPRRAYPRTPEGFIEAIKRVVGQPSDVVPGFRLDKFDALLNPDVYKGDAPAILPQSDEYKSERRDKVDESTDW